MKTAGIAFIMLMLTPLHAAAGTASCLATDPAAADDAADLLAVREAVDTECPCGGPWEKRGDYLRCAKNVLKDAILDGR